MSNITVDRRAFVLTVASIGGSLAFGCKARRQGAAVEAAGDDDKGIPINAWISVSRSNKVSVLLDKSEIGQGVWTMYAAIVAEELSLELDDISVLPGPADDRFGNKKIVIRARGLPVPLPVQLTGLSTSTADAWANFRKVAAGVREAFRRAAAVRSGDARRWGESTFNGSSVTMASRTYQLSELIDDVMAIAPAITDPRVMPSSDYRILGTRGSLGTNPRRLDTASKIDGTARFGIDVTARMIGEETLLHAIVIHAPERGADIRQENMAEITAMPGITHGFPILGGKGVAIVGRTYYQVLKASRSLRFTTTPGQAAGFNSDNLLTHYIGVMNNPANGTVITGDAAGTLTAMRGAPQKVGEFFVPYAPHVPMEPMNATARIKGGLCEVWAPTQFPGAAQAAAAKVAGLMKDQVKVNVMLSGGGFGRRLLADFVSEVVAISKELGGAAVKLTYSREEDFKQDFFRPAACHRIKVGFEGGFRIKAWQHEIATQPISEYCIQDYVGALLPDLTPGTIVNDWVSAGGRLAVQAIDVDPFSYEGADDTPYKRPQRGDPRGLQSVLRLFQLRGGNMPRIPIGYWRSVGHLHTAFAIESFMDEIGAVTGRSPTELRRSYLNGEARAMAVLNRVVEISGFEQKYAQRNASGAPGLAQHSGWGSHCAMVAEVLVNADMTFTVRRMYAVVDCGYVLQPDQVKAQIEGGIVFGLSSALKQEITFVRGTPQQSNFHNSDILRMHECPEIIVDLIQQPSDVAPSGVGELPVPPVAPAVRNALFAATRRALRSLPLTAAALREMPEPA